MSRFPAVHPVMRRAEIVERDCVEVEEHHGGDLPIRILHIARQDMEYEIAYCGRRRDKPLSPRSADGEMCVVCAAEFERRWGYPWRGGR